MEETDLCYRIQLLGKRNYYYQDAAIKHLGQQSSNQAAQWTNVQLQLSTYAFLVRNQLLNPTRKILLTVFMQIGAVIRLALWLSRWVCARRSRCVSTLMIKGYLKLFIASFAFSCIVDSALKEGHPIKWSDSYLPRLRNRV